MKEVIKQSSPVHLIFWKKIVQFELVARVIPYSTKEKRSEKHRDLKKSRLKAFCEAEGVFL